MSSSPSFRLTHGVLPLVAVSALLIPLLAFGLDQRIAQALFYDPLTGWMGAEATWANLILHSGGRALVIAVALASLVTWCVSWNSPALRAWRWPAAYTFLTILLSTSIVGALKHSTNIDCPWSLSGFGGDRPYVGLFGDRPDGLVHAACFPGAHSASGFALMCLHFSLRDRFPRAARLALAGGLLIGASFALGQEARGAHFVSHDLVSAALVWYISLGAYELMRRVNARPPPRSVAQHSHPWRRC